MNRLLLFWVITAVVVCGIPVGADAAPRYADKLPLYDDFSSPAIDTTKWSFNPATTSIVNGAVQIVSNVTGSISTAANVGFTPPHPLQAVSADVTITNYQVSGGTHWARLTGSFYNDGTQGGTPGSSLGDIMAGVFMKDTGIYYGVWRCLDSICGTWEYLTGDGTNNHVFLAGSAVGQTHTLFIRWDGSVFTFQVDTNTPVSYDPKPKAPVAISLPNKVSKSLNIRHLETDGQYGNVTATFDNVRATFVPFVWRSVAAGASISGSSSNEAQQTSYYAITVKFKAWGIFDPPLVSGIFGLQDTLGVTEAFNYGGFLDGSTIRLEGASADPKADPTCGSRTIEGIGTFTEGGLDLSLSGSAGTTGNCSAFSDWVAHYDYVSPSIRTAIGTYSYTASSATLTWNVDSSTFGPNCGISVGPDQMTVTSITSTKLTMGNVVFTRDSGIAGDISGIWTMNMASGDVYQFLFDKDGTFRMIGYIITPDVCGTAYGWSGHRNTGPAYYGSLVFDDPAHEATSVVVTGPNILSSLNLQYNANEGRWDNFNSQVNFGSTHPAAPLLYEYLVSTASGTFQDRYMIGCFIEDVVSNLSVTFDLGGKPTFKWTKLPPAVYWNMGYQVWLESPLGGPWLWESDPNSSNIDISSMVYSGPSLTPGTYNYIVHAESTKSSFNCEANSFGSFTYAPATLTVSRSSVDFGNRLINTLSTAQTVTVRNTGSAPLKITSISLSGTNPAMFAKTTTCPIGGAGLIGGGACTVSVTFGPTSTGAKSASLAINVASPAVSKTIALTGTGVTPFLSVTPLSRSFGNLLINTISSAKTVTVSNTGTAPLAILSTSLTGTNPAMFAKTSTCPGSLAPGAACAITVTFKPTSTGAKSASLGINVAAPAVSKTVALTGTGTAPIATVTPALLSFPTRSVGTTSAAKTVTVNNTGTAPLVILSTSLTGTNSGQFSKTTTCPIGGGGLASGATCTVSVKFKPTSVGEKSASLGINVAAPAVSKTVSLSGTGQ